MLPGHWTWSPLPRAVPTRVASRGVGIVTLLPIGLFVGQAVLEHRVPRGLKPRDLPVNLADRVGVVDHAGGLIQPVVILATADDMGRRGSEVLARFAVE